MNSEKMIDVIKEDLKAKVEKDGFVDVGKGVETLYSVSRERFRNIVAELAVDEPFLITPVILDGDNNIVSTILSKRELNAADIENHRNEWMENRLWVTNLARKAENSGG